MTKAEILYELGLEELVGTSFEDMIFISEMKEGDYICLEEERELCAYYIIEGKVQAVLYTPEGGEFYLDFCEGEIAGVNFSFSKKEGGGSRLIFDADGVAKKDSKIAYLPLEKIMDLEFKGKKKVLKKLIMMSMDEHFREASHFLLKNIYSDEEFFIKHLEECKTINARNTKELSEFLNINLRSLQRFLKKLQDQEIIEKCRGRIEIKDQAKLQKYKKRFEK